MTIVWTLRVVEVGAEIPMGWGTIEIDIDICGNTLQITPGRLAPTPKNQSQKDIGPTLFLRYWLPLAITKNIPFHRLFGEIFPWLCPPNIHFSPQNGNTHAAPICIWLGGGGGNYLITEAYHNNNNNNIFLMLDLAA